jgi:CDP-glycerol:poly(glycerophosphate) glycerophosphotransferase
MGPLARAVRRLDTAVGRALGPRRVVVDARTPMNAAILAPVAEALRRDSRVEVTFTAAAPADLRAMSATAGAWFRVVPRRALLWRRVDLCLTADPWDPIELRRCGRRANFFHGTAGKYDLDAPDRLPAGFGDYDRVAFINADRMRRYLDAGAVKPDAAVLVGFPKVDALVNGRYDAAAIRANLHLEPSRRTAMYAPTWSPASSLHVAGEAIVTNLVASGLNVIVKLHDRSLDMSDARFSGGIDWRARFAAIHVPGRTAFVEVADSSPLLAASDVMVTDHSSIGFEFCLIDRPIIVVDVPGLVESARINPGKVALLRRAARVVSSADETAAAAVDEIANPERLSPARHAVAREMFHEPGTATTRAIAMVYELLDLPAPDRRGVPVRDADIAESVS